MATDFDQFPLDDPFIKKGTLDLSNVWRDSLATFFQSLIGYLTSGGIFVPPITSSQRDALIAPTNGQMIYNTTTNKFQGYENGSWVNLI